MLMYLLGLGLLFMAMKYLDIGPVGAWDWWVVLSPLGLAVLWWAWADSTGYTKRQAMKREDARRQARIDRNKDAIGKLSNKRRR
jgi:small Trp-rich protein